LLNDVEATNIYGQRGQKSYNCNFASEISQLLAGVELYITERKKLHSPYYVYVGGYKLYQQEMVRWISISTNTLKDLEQ
jgi:hypothetical protein